MLRVAIVGCGLIGRKRAAALSDARVVTCVDANIARAQALAQELPEAPRVHVAYGEAVQREDVDVVIVATTHDALAEIALAALEHGKHVLVEKPAGRNSREIEPMLAALERSQSIVHVGFNHRYHAAFQRAKALAAEDAIGPLLYVRARYGHGGRIGYESEWRANPALSGGGELIDQGVHLIDLSRWFLGDFVRVEGTVHTYYWNMPVEDNGFLVLATEHNQTAFLHASCTEWKNLFSFELFGRDGKLEVTGLGGSYGVERLTYYRMRPELGPPDTTIWEYPGPDRSWEAEWLAFSDEIRHGERTGPGLRDAYAALQIVETVYEANGRRYS